MSVATAPTGGWYFKVGDGPDSDVFWQSVRVLQWFESRAVVVATVPGPDRQGLVVGVPSLVKLSELRHEPFEW